MADTLLPAETPAAPQANEAAPFVDRRSQRGSGTPGRERRQFTNSHSGLSDEAAELASAIDSYKARHRRRFINYEEMLNVVKALGYSR
ncbi:hypothetical protein MalM25_25960 [Planctomycetes bacterium MalM25]|nr:hypothetical protein MalM25_25960 [Planctomycetes bacterium MalM25]